MPHNYFEQITSSNKRAIIATQMPLALFYKQRLNNKVLYTMVQSGQVKSFEAADYSQPHQDEDFELMYVLKGQLTNFIEGQEFYFKAGDGCLLPPQITHAESLDIGCTVIFINLSQPLLRTLLDATTGTGTIFSFLNQNLKSNNQWKRNYLEITRTIPVPYETFQIIMDSLQQEVATKKIGATYFQHGLVLRLLSALEDTARFNIKNVDLDASKEDYLVHRVIHFIDERLGQASRSDIQQRLHYNAEYLNRLLKKQTGQTLTEYAQLVRLQKAKQLLVATNLKINAIAEQLGFNSETYFYHYFKKNTNLSPNQYRHRFK